MYIKCCYDFFVKQKTAYELRISDWSSDVCASDLTLNLQATAREFLADLATSGGGVIFIDSLEMFTSPARRRTVNDLLREVAAIEGLSIVATSRPECSANGDGWLAPELASLRSEERRVGKECVSPGRSRGAP